MKACNFQFLILFTAVLLVLSGCHGRQSDMENTNRVQSVPRTSVRVAYPSDTVHFNDELSLNATATYLLKSDVKANITGYIIKMNIKLADNVRRGQFLFGLQTKEAHVLESTINKLDPSFRFSGKMSVVSPTSGYITMLNHQSGDYVQEGDVLATIADAASFGFLMEVPYEYNQFIYKGKEVIVNLPDGRSLTGNIVRIMPSVNLTAQTQQVLVKVKHGENIPEYLIATINLVKSSTTGICVPKKAVLTNDTQSDFWVMKLINDSVAVKTNIRKGIEFNNWIQVLSGGISLKDRIVTTGNYGMSDTTFVKIQGMDYSSKAIDKENQK